MAPQADLQLAPLECIIFYLQRTTVVSIEQVTREAKVTVPSESLPPKDPRRYTHTRISAEVLLTVFSAGGAASFNHFAGHADYF